jgi:hypothetical protein
MKQKVRYSFNPSTFVVNSSWRSRSMHCDHDGVVEKVGRNQR